MLDYNLFFLRHEICENYDFNATNCFYNKCENCNEFKLRNASICDDCYWASDCELNGVLRRNCKRLHYKYYKPKEVKG